ncbi:hypothetical protein EC973_002936 [Apophysomyces ossiformis]|uniref:DH domain-containing protein n=1 Tax=Apophysomyces ossiformis TaxID=679940 RepID=A0A8H7BN25_9FUNG|nr:hypothetical protein EC973_002936 [Apophysomyces ossiformis]
MSITLNTSRTHDKEKRSPPSSSASAKSSKGSRIPSTFGCLQPLLASIARQRHPFESVRRKKSQSGPFSFKSDRTLTNNNSRETHKVKAYGDTISPPSTVPSRTPSLKMAYSAYSPTDPSSPNMATIHEDAHQTTRHLSLHQSKKKLPERARSVFRSVDKEMEAMTTPQTESVRNQRANLTQSLSSKDSAMKNLITNELYTTEQSYYRLLTLIQTRYMQPIMTASQTKDPLMKSGDIPALFRHLPDLITLSGKLLVAFENGLCIGPVFKSLEPDIVVFLKYAIHYQANLKTIRRACHNPLFIKIDQESRTQKDTNRMGISDYFIAPIQRVPRYCLLIKGLLKHMDPSDPEFSELSNVLVTLTGLAIAMDHAQKVPRKRPRTI